MSKRTTDLTREARLGYAAAPEETSPFLRSSPSDAAWRVGAWLRKTFRSPPSGVRTGRGDLVHVNNMQVKLCWDYDPVTIERIA